MTRCDAFSPIIPTRAHTRVMREVVSLSVMRHCAGPGGWSKVWRGEVGLTTAPLIRRFFPGLRVSGTAPVVGELLGGRWALRSAISVRVLVHRSIPRPAAFGREVHACLKRCDGLRKIRSVGLNK